MPDARVTTALEHWAGRMVANGVPFADLEHIRRHLSSWSQWCGMWTERAAVHAGLGDDAAERGHTTSAAEHWVTAAAVYHFAKFLFFEDAVQARAAARAAVESRTRALPHLDPPGLRVEIPFEGTVLPGNLRVPTGAGKAALVVMISGLDSAKEEMHNHEQDFLRRGLATFAFDGPGQGEVEHELPIRADFEVPVAAVLDALAERREIDARRVALWGVSLGGYYAPRAAAFDRRVAACVALSGPFHFGETWDDLPDVTRAAFQVRSHSTTAEQARASAGALDLSGVASGIRCPLLVISGGRDRLFDASHPDRLAAAASGPVTRLHVAEGAHVVNNLPFRYRPQTADWLADALAS